MKHYNSIQYFTQSWYKYIYISLIYLFFFVLFHCKPSVHAATPSFSSFLLQLRFGPVPSPPHHPKPHLWPLPPRPLSLFQLLVIMQVPDWLTGPAARQDGKARACPAVGRKTGGLRSEGKRWQSPSSHTPFTQAAKTPLGRKEEIKMTNFPSPTLHPAFC